MTMPKNMDSRCAAIYILWLCSRQFWAYIYCWLWTQVYEA